MAEKKWTPEVVGNLKKDRASHTLSQLGAMHGVSRERIRQILMKEARRLRREEGMSWARSNELCGLKVKDWMREEDTEPT